MAITIEQQPNSPRYSRGPLVYVLSSTNINETRFSFHVTVNIGGVELQPFRKQPNPTQRGIINLASIIDDGLEWETAPLGQSTEATSLDLVKAVTVTFREEYVDNTGTTLLVNPTTATTIHVIKGISEFDTISLTDAQYSSDTILTDLPENNQFQLNSGESALVSWWDNSANMVLHRPIRMGDTETIAGQTITAVAAPTTTNSRLMQWVNRRGGWNTFRFTEDETVSNSVDKSIAAASEITHGFTDSRNRVARNTNVYKSTQNVYSTTYGVTYTTNSRWINNDEDWILGIIDSPLVYHQDGTEFKPVNVTNSSYDGMGVTREFNHFQFPLIWQYSNNKRGF